MQTTTINILLFFFPFLLLGQDLAVYNLTSFQKSEDEINGFISLSDSYPLSMHADSLIIADTYLGEQANAENHQLDAAYRSRFLSRMNWNETDTIFIYFLSLDSIAKYPVHDLPLVANMTPYGVNYIVSQYDYMVGFEFGEKRLGKDYWYLDNFVCIGKDNPFVRDRILPMKWEEIEQDCFPLSEHNNIFTNSKVVQTYLFMTEKFDYYLRNLSRDGRQIGRHLIVVESSNEAILLEEFYGYSEGSGLKPLNIIDVDYGHGFFQWAGAIFKDMPVMLFGFKENSFGCPKIQFLDKTASFIFLRCDNRH
mgnify:CR=1 FL=1